MITDRMTAKVLGLIVFMLALTIDASCVIFARPETRHNPRFAVVLALTSLPMFLASALFFRKASRLPDTDDEKSPPG
jgi:hypothetical protein